MITSAMRDFPIVQWRCSGTMDAADVQTLIVAQESVLARDQRCAIIFDASDMKSIGASELRTLAAHAKQHHATMARLVVTMVIVTSSPLIRGALKAFLWMQPLAHPHQVCATFAEGQARVFAAASAAGLAVRTDGPSAGAP